MIRNITLGRYYDTDSFYHRLDPRTKILTMLLFAISLFLTDELWMFSIPFAFVVYQLIASRLKVRFVIKGLLRLFFTFAVLAGVTGLSFHNWETGICMFLRLVLLVVGSSVLTYTTTPSEISHGLNKIIRNDDICMIFCIALRYLPILSSQALTIYQSQQNRGLNLKNKTLKQKVKLSLAVIIPMFASSFRVASELGDAMDARLFGFTKRTSLREFKFTGYDFTFFLLFTAYILSIVEVRYVC